MLDSCLVIGQAYSSQQRSAVTGAPQELAVLYGQDKAG